MFSALKQELRNINSINETNDLIIESFTNNDVRDLFVDIDSVDENDPKLEKIINSLPEGNDYEEEIEAEKIIESYVGGV